MLTLSTGITISDSEVEFSAIRAQGAGGQNVNKVSSAIHLRFDIRASSLPDDYKERLLSMRDARVTQEGQIVIKAQRYRSQDDNRQDALLRLGQFIERAMVKKKPRKPSRPSLNARKKRMDSKTKRGQVKNLRGRVDS